ncbi:MAG: MFS transporter [Anaerolineae bacterium]|jgi:MFS family permease
MRDLSPESRPRKFVQWLLELDRSEPQHSDQELAALVERDYRWNFAVNLGDGITFWLAMSFLGNTTIVPLFISKLTPSMLPIGYAAMLAQAGWFLPQLFTANWVEQMPRRKPVAVNLGLVLERLPVLFLALTALLAGRWTGLALASFLIMYTWNRLGGGVIATAWQDLIARVIPLERRGLFWGLTTAIGAALGFGGAALSAWLLTAYAFPTNFAIVFSLAAVILLGGWFFSALIREPAYPVSAPKQGQREFLRHLPQLIRQDRPFRRFLVARMLLTLSVMGLGFITVAAVQRWGVADGTVGLYTGVLLLGQTVGNLTFGLLADRRGHKSSLEWAGVAYCLAFALAWLSPDAAWYYLVFFLLGAGQGIVIVSGILVVLEFCEPQRRPTYVGLTNTAVGLVGVTGPLVAAWLAGVDYGLLFAICAAISLMAWVAMRWWVQEPRWAGRR